MRFQKPTPEEVSRYAYKIGFILNGDEFCDYYESKGWVVGKAPMKCWQAAIRTWKAKEYRFGKKIDPRANQAPPDADKLAAAKARMDAIREREFQKRELVRLAQERDDLKSKKMAEASGDKEESGPDYHFHILDIAKNLKDENGNKWIENQERFNADAE